MTEARLSGVIYASPPKDADLTVIRQGRLHIPTHARRPGMLVRQVHGDSMAGEHLDAISDGDIVFIDRRDTAIAFGYPFAFRWGKILIAKRFELVDGALALVSDNPAYSPIWDVYAYERVGRIYARHLGGLSVQYLGARAPQ